MIKECSEHMLKDNLRQWSSSGASHYMAEAFEYSRAALGISLLNRAY